MTQETTQKRPPRSLAEWVTFSIASTILSAIATLVIYTWVTDQQEPPVLEVSQTNQIREANGQFYVPFELSNMGGETVESVQVVAELRVNGQVQESGDQQIDFLSSREKAEGGFVFRRDPRKGELIIRVASYKVP
jgi:uncharacterized protein (TIGR02588 family)